MYIYTTNLQIICAKFEVFLRIKCPTKYIFTFHGLAL